MAIAVSALLAPGNLEIEGVATTMMEQRT